jgi:membrane protein implicated in regulation of membrane protease activity
MGAVAVWVTRAVMRMPTDATVRTADLVGKTGTVVTAIPAAGYGEVAVHHHGQRMKLNARAATPVAAGVAVVVTEVTSPSSVHVEPESTFWRTSEQGAM